MKIPYNDIKHPLLHMINGDGTTVWWDDDDDINFFDDIPSNFPRWTIGCFVGIDEAIKRFKRMTEEEGWTVVENNLDDFIKSQKLVTVSGMGY